MQKWMKRSNLIIISEVRFKFAGGTRRPELVVIQSVGNCSYYSSSQQKRLTDLVQRLSVRHAPVKRTARRRCALQSTSIYDCHNYDIYEHFCNIF